MMTEAELLGVLESARYVLCSRGGSWDGKQHTWLNVMDADKEPLGVELPKACYDAVLAYCEAHPDKWAHFDGCCLMFPRDPAAPLPPDVELLDGPERPIATEADLDRELARRGVLRSEHPIASEEDLERELARRAAMQPASAGC